MLCSKRLPLHAPVAKGCAVDLHGWAEPGTMLTANGETTPVAPDGLFLAQVTPSAEGKIKLEARRENDTKRLMRHFQPLPSPSP
jgi:hypothetical protein